ncbi:MAG: hypothetical protein GX260_02220 [Tissierellia bacterium]|jgi:hypothetical protein|nr:hypothetical protein [Bacillota bacterium]NLL22583.1 hypothetical protein [Tissierellia bacterium]
MSSPKIPRRAMIILLLLCAALVMLLSLEVLFLVKDADFYSNFQARQSGATFSDYLNARLFMYFIQIVPIMSVALYTFFLAQRMGTPPAYRLIWGLLLGASALLRLLQTTLMMPVSLGILAVYIALILVVINIHRL